MFDDFSFRMLELAHEGFCCSQILIKLALESETMENTDLVRAMGGLCYGVANSGNLCGVLTGGICLLALKSSSDGDIPVPGYRFHLMADTYTQWFTNRIGNTYGGIKCSDIFGKEIQQPHDLGKCSTVLTESYAKLMEILDEYNR
ncbi:MAG: C_GCAxxG_C_C family protein [Deltaproteobacteria bacterium]|nr:C_GCAxxG_C_C family protein [Deltaproteobacteria bacterium]